jgi:hypothetical protein
MFTLQCWYLIKVVLADVFIVSAHGSRTLFFPFYENPTNPFRLCLFKSAKTNRRNYDRKIFEKHLKSLNFDTLDVFFVKCILCFELVTIRFNFANIITTIMN